MAFGRPFLRRADRPAVNIPPRKRRRITYDEEDDHGSGEQVNDRQIVVRAGFEDTDELDVNDESEEDEDFAPDDGEEDLDEELEDLQDDMRINANYDEQAPVGSKRGERKRSTRSQTAEEGLGLRLLDDISRDFSEAYSNPLLDYYGQPEVKNRASALTVRKRHPPRQIQSSRRNHGRDLSPSPERASRRSSAGSSKSVRFEDTELETPATIRELDDSDDSDDEDDRDFDTAETNESDKENAEPVSDNSGSSKDILESKSSTHSESELSEKDTSSSGSSSDSNSDSGPDQLPIISSHQNPKPSKTSSSASLSSSISGSESKTQFMNVKRNSVPQETTPNTSVERATHSGVKTVQVMAPAGEGQKKTRMRNQRRRVNKKLKYLKARGLLPLHATQADLHKSKLALDNTAKTVLVAEEGSLEEGPLEDGDDKDAAFDTRRQALIESTCSGEVDERPEIDQADVVLANTTSIPRRLETEENFSATVGDLEEITRKTIEERSYSGLPFSTEAACGTTVLVPDSHPESIEDSMAEEVDGRAPVETPSIMTSITQGVPAENSRTRRAKLDLASSKRLLFGSLGLRTPKTKEDESNLRKKLMKESRPSRKSQSTILADTKDDVVAGGEDDSWKERIILRAVECCHEGIELSTPPFPFVQRWDPQQQRGYNTTKSKRRNKGKKRKRNDESYYEVDFNRSTQGSAVRQEVYDSPIDQIQYEGEIANGPERTSKKEQSHESHEQNDKDTVAAEDLLMQEAGYNATFEPQEEVADLPGLPVDLSVCPKLGPDTCRVGDIVAFKEFHMSAETNWQPGFSDHLTAIIDEITEDGILHMTLAKRDQQAEHVHYDEVTGERLYSKFEMPGYSDGVDQEDNSKREISFEDLISPILIQAADDKLDASAKNQTDSSDSSQDQLSDTLMGEEGQRQLAGPPESLHDSTDQLCSNQVVEPTEQARQGSSDLISDAGRRSILQSEIESGLKAHGELVEHDGTASSHHPSPKFHGFGSSPNGPDDDTTVLFAESPASDSRIYSNVEVAESVPPQYSSGSRALSSTLAVEPTVKYPDLPHINNDSEDFQDQSQRHSLSPEINQKISFQEPMMPSSLRFQAPRSSSSRPHDLNVKSPAKAIRTLDGTDDSEEEFPELFSQAFDMRMPQDVQVKAELSEDDEMEALPKRRPKSIDRLSSSENEHNAAWRPSWSDVDNEGDNDAELLPHPSQPSQVRNSSQMVDLTMSSDSAEPSDDPYGQPDGGDSCRPSSEPGQVSKPGVNRVLGNSKLSRERRKTRSR